MLIATTGSYITDSIRFVPLSCITSRVPFRFDITVSMHYTPYSCHLLDRHALGQVTRKVDVETLCNGEPVGHELERDDIEQALEDIDCLWDLDLVRLIGGELGVLLVADDDWAALARNHLLVCVERLGKDVVASQDHDNGQILVHERQHAVLQLARHDCFAVEVGDFLDFERTCFLFSIVFIPIWLFCFLPSSAVAC